MITGLFFESLRSLFDTVYVSVEVKNEYEKGAALDLDRNWLLKRLHLEEGFFRLCTVYDSFAMIAVTGFKGMDRGEAQSYAQLKKINAEIIISDDKRFTTALGILDPYIKVYNTLHLICWLDKQSLVPEWNDLIKQIHSIRPFRSADLHTAYRDILKRFGINESKRSISKKCSLKNILGTP